MGTVSLNFAPKLRPTGKRPWWVGAGGGGGVEGGGRGVLAGGVLGGEFELGLFKVQHPHALVC